MKKTHLLAAILLTVGATSAQAAGYAGFDAGYGKADQGPAVSALGQALANASGNTVAATYATAASAGRLFVGWNVAKDIDVELGYLKTSSLDATFTGTTAGGVAFSLKTGFDASGFDAAVVWWPMDGVFVKGGLHSSDVNLALAANVASASATYSVSRSGTGALVGVGYESDISKTMGWRVAYTRYNSLGGLDGADMDLVSAGLKMKF